jgi:hypothetical protein
VTNQQKCDILLQGANLPSVTADLTAAPPAFCSEKDRKKVVSVLWLKRVPNDDSAWKNGSELNSDGLVEKY